MNKLSIAMAAALSVGLVLPVSADILELKSGDIIKGDYAGGSQNSIRFNINGEMEVIPVSDVLSVTFTGRAATQSAPQQAAPAPQPAPQAAASNGPVEVAAGTEFMIRTRSVLDSGKLGQNNKFTAVLEADLVSNGVVVAEQGDTVYGRVVSVKKAGRVAGNAHIDLELTGIKIDGQIEPIATNVLHLTTDSTLGGSAKKTVGAAAIGGLIDGSSGAKTGAKVGLGMSILTPGNQVVVPANTLLDFRFKVALRL